MAIDFQKAFDSVSCAYLDKVMTVFNFGETVLKWIKIFYKNMQSCVMNNGYSTGYFDIGRGVRQGDPLSPYLFILALELIAIKIRTTNTITGITIKTENKLSIYADDLTATLRDIDSVKIVFDMLEQFANVSGLHVNQTKTQAMWIGSEANRADRPLDLAWSAELKITGIFFTYDQDRELELNLDKRMKKIKGVISSWKQRNLSLVGRTQILKTFVISQLLFVTNVIRVPENIIKQVDAIMYNFIWGGPDKIKRCVMIKPLEEGGMKVPDIKSKIATQRVGWIRRLLSGESHPWKEFPNLLLEQMGGAHILNSEIDMQYMKPKLPNFYYEILDAWTKLKLNMVPPKPAGEQCLWSNRNVKIGGKVIFFKEFAENGINYVHELYNRVTARLMTWTEMKTKTGLTERSVLQWYGLLSSMPKKWKRLSVAELDDVTQGFYMVEHNIKRMIHQVTSKQIYANFIGNIKVTMTNQVYFNQKYGVQNEWEEVYNRIYDTTIESKLRSFQFKIVHNILFTNSRLYNAGLVNSELCSFCKEQRETVYHLFHGCPVVTTVWQYVIQNIFRQFGMNHITIEEKLFGVNARNAREAEYENFVNHIILLTKWHIHKSRIINIMPNINDFKSLICSTRLIEKNIALKRNKVTKHNAKWIFMRGINID